MSVIAVTGLAREARIARCAGLMPVIGAGNRTLLETRLEAAIAKETPRGIVSFGIAGALAPLLKVGDIIVATDVVHGRERYATDPKWNELLHRKLPSAKPATLVGNDHIVSDPDDKRFLFEMSRALAVDMESHIAARLAGRHGIPFVALRTISDAATRALPPAALLRLKPSGRIRLGAVLASVAVEPSQIRDLLTTGREAGRGLEALLRSRDALGLSLGCPYLG